MNDKQRIQAELKAIREETPNPGPDIGSWDRLLCLLEVIYCDHKFVVKRLGGPPDMAESYEAVKVCDLCGYEPSDE
jgi:hypothetical protein